MSHTGAGRLTPAGLSIRPARPDDARTVRRLDDLAFPPDDPDRQRADPGELEDAVAVGDVQLLELAGQPTGYLHADFTVPGRIYVSGLAIHPAAQRQGLGSLLIRECLASIDPATRAGTPIVTVTSPRNHAMLRILFDHGFAARWVLRDYFGHGRDRFGLQLRARPTLPAPGPSRHVRADALADVYRTMEHRGEVVHGLTRQSGLAYFALTPHRELRFPAGAAPP